MNISNSDVKGITSEIPESHQHIRTTIELQDGQHFTFQEATIANLVRAYIAVKTHPARKKVILRGAVLEKRKQGYAEWQLLEDD